MPPPRNHAGSRAATGVLWDDVDFKCEAASWLKALHKDTAWLAEQCGVTKKTVERWLMPWTRIPAARREKLEELMKEYPEPGR